MNAQIASLQSLSFALQTRSLSAAHPARRRFVDRSPVQPDALEHFNKLLAQLCYTPLDNEAPASVPFNRQPVSGDQPDCLATVVARMLADAGWQVAETAIVPARLVLEKVGNDNYRGRAGGSSAGQFFYATVIDAAWPKLIEEVDCYLDFCRIRTIEAGLRGCAIDGFAFDRRQWRLARRADAALASRRGRPDAGRYLSATTTCAFRVC